MLQYVTPKYFSCEQDNTDGHLCLECENRSCEVEKDFKAALVYLQFTHDENRHTCMMFKVAGSEIKDLPRSTSVPLTTVTTKKQKESKPAVVAAIVVSVLLIFIIVVASVLCWRRKMGEGKKKERETPLNDLPGDEHVYAETTLVTSQDENNIPKYETVDVVDGKDKQAENLYYSPAEERIDKRANQIPGSDYDTSVYSDVKEKQIVQNGIDFDDDKSPLLSGDKPKTFAFQSDQYDEVGSVMHGSADSARKEYDEVGTVIFHQ
ncbi:uncharacterized protein LOC130625763 isoform X2 [Hydractinia symbiolongicarpus]|nr:uncharacterized protein LOC130625763 isoform X2 [Hydractinia symbiolongicarpus]